MVTVELELGTADRLKNLLMGVISPMTYEEEKTLREFIIALGSAIDDEFASTRPCSVSDELTLEGAPSDVSTTGQPFVQVMPLPSDEWQTSYEYTTTKATLEEVCAARGVPFPPPPDTLVPSGPELKAALEQGLRSAYGLKATLPPSTFEEVAAKWLRHCIAQMVPACLMSSLVWSKVCTGAVERAMDELNALGIGYEEKT